MSKTYYVCKYTPVELMKAYGGECANFNEMPEGFDLADQVAHPNICGFGKALIEAVMAGEVKELVLTNCCDTIRSVADVLASTGKLDFLYLLDILHTHDCCSQERTALELKQFARAYSEYKGVAFNEDAFRAAFCKEEQECGPYFAVLGARMGTELFDATASVMPLSVRNLTCVNTRSVKNDLPREGASFDELMMWYADALLGQVPCMRMQDNTGRKQLFCDPNLRGIIYHTVKFCDFYSFEYADIVHHAAVPVLKIESD